MIDLHASREIEGIVEYFRATGVLGHVSSTFRPGARTAAGHPSRHGRKLAVDFGDPAPGLDTPGLLEIFRAFVPVEAHLNELILATAPYNIKRGKRVRRYAERLHHGHVHVAVDPGVDLAELFPKMAVHSDEIIDDTDGREDMADPVDGMCSPQGGVWVLTRDGGVRSYDHAEPITPFYGSYFSLEERHRNVPRTFVQIKPRSNDREGYVIVASSGEEYEFGK
jgi:hypothetical protein